MGNDERQRNQNCQYVYFIENHIINATLTISLENNTKEVNSLEEIELPNYESDKGIEYKCTLYRFKLEIKQRKKIDVIINLKDGNDEIFSKKINIPDTSRDNYIYDFFFEPKKTKFEIKEPPISFGFSHCQQFEIYVNFLRRQNIKQQDKNNIDLILSTQLLLMEEGKTYKFSFYLMILLECFATSLIQAHLDAFRIEKIEEIGEIKTPKIKIFKDIIGNLERKPEKTLVNINNIDKKEEYGIKLFTVFIYFDYNFARDNLSNLFSSKDENIQNYIVKSLIERKNDLFINFKLTKEEMHNLLNCIKDIEQLNIILAYNVTNLFELISIVYDEYNTFSDIFSIKVNKKASMNIEEIIMPNENDNLKEINEKYIELVKREKESNKNIFFLIEVSLLEKYIIFYEGKNIENLIYIKNIVEITRENIDKKFKIKDLNEIIHESGLKLSKEHSLKNNDILEFIKKDEYYNLKEYNKKIYRSLDILNGLDINSFDENFYLNWKRIDWCRIFDEQYYDFIVKISCLIKDMKDFDILFKLFDISKDKNQQDYDRYSLNIMQSKFFELLEKYDPKEFPIIKDDLILLIFFSDQKRENIEDFLIIKLQKNLSFNAIREIYITLLSSYKDLISSDTKIIITDFYNKNESNKETLLNLIKKYPQIPENMLENIDDYIIRKEEFLEQQENAKMILFKALLDEKILEKPEFQDTYYAQKVVSTINKIQNEIIKGEILYRDISKFYNNDENDKEKQKILLYQRLVIISLNKQNEAKKLFDIIDKYYIKINNILEDLKIILEDFFLFFKKKEKKNIILLKNIIEEIKDGNLNYFEKNKKKNIDVEILINNFKNEVIDRNILRKSNFFSYIFENNKKMINDDDICLNETLKNFNELSILFEAQGIQKLNQNILKICLEEIQGKSKEEISQNIDILKNIFVKTKNIKVTNEESLINDFIILSRKNYVYNVTSSILLFIEKLGLKKQSLWRDCEKIISTLQVSYKKEDIENSLHILNNFGIKIDILCNYENSEDIKYLDILLKLKDQPDSITFLLKIKKEKYRSLEELIVENDITFLNLDDILILEKCAEFMKELGNEETFKDKIDIDAINSFKEKVEKCKNIEIFFNNYVINYLKIKSLLEYGLYYQINPSKHRIGLICKKSKFILKNIKGFFKGEYYDDENIQGKTITIKKDKLLELRDFAQSRRIVKIDDEELKNIIEKYKKFIERVSEIININNVLKEIYKVGFPKEIKVQINIENYLSRFIIFGLEEDKKEEEKEEEKEYNKNLMILISTLNKFKKAQIIGYRNFPLTRFFYGRQFSLFYNILKEKEINKDKLFPFLMLLTNNLMKNDLNNFSHRPQKNIHYDMFFLNIQKFLEEILNKHNYSENIYEKTLIKKKDKEYKRYKGVYLYLCDKLENDLTQIYIYLTGNNPVAKAVLLCNEETTNEELTSFLYRAILCEYNSCFIIGGIEFLEFNKKSKLLELLNKLYIYDNENMMSCLIILYTSRATDIYKSLDSLKYINILNIKKENFEKLKILTNVEIISSDFSGVGKSTEIKRLVEMEHKKYIYFPLGGVLKKQDIIKRLKKLKFSKDSVLHLDLSDTEQTDIMMEFLFSILIIKLYGENENIFYLYKEVDIKIEIQNGYIDLLHKYPILTLFHLKKLSINNLAPLIVENDLNSNAQIVANYLKALKNNIIDKNDLYFEKISPEVFSKYKTKYDATILSQRECEVLIFDEIKTTIKAPNYYQITSFINILADQFRKFSINFYFEANTLTYIKKKIPFRKMIIENLIKVTKHFCEGAFRNIIKWQKKQRHQ